MRIGVAFGGGAVRGLAHVGVLAVLLENNIRVACVSGCSAGSIVGSTFSAGLSIGEMRRAMPHIHWRRLAAIERTEWGYFNFEKLERLLIMMVGDISFEELALPFAAVTMDLATGERVVLREGSVARAVRASCSIPGIVNPVEIDGRLLADGGIVDNLPVMAAKELGADYVIAIDVFSPNFDRGWGPLGKGITAVETMVRNAGGGVGLADFLISVQTAGASYLRFSQHQDLELVGRQAAEATIPDLLADLATRGS